MFLKTKVNLGAVEVQISDSVKAAAVHRRGGEKSDFTLFTSTFPPLVSSVVLLSCTFTCGGCVTQVFQIAGGFDKKEKKRSLTGEKFLHRVQLGMIFTKVDSEWHINCDNAAL